MDNLLQVQNGELVKRSIIPCVSFDRFNKILTDFVSKDGFIVQFFAFVEDDQNRLSTEVREDFPSFTASCSEKFHMFEREIAEQYGITPLNHPYSSGSI